MSDNPAKKMYAGKYETPETLEQGYNSLFTESQKLLAKAKALEEQNRILQAVAESRREPETEGDTNEGISPETIKQLVASGVQEILAPLLTGAEKVALLGSEQGEINSFLQANPEVQATFQGISDAKGAAEYARALWKLNQHAQGDKRVEQSTREARTVMDASLGAAEVPGSRSISRTPSDPNQEHSEKLKAAWEQAEKTGDATEYVRQRLFGGPNKLEIWHPGEAVPPSMLPKGN